MVIDRAIKTIQEFISIEASSGIILLAMAILAIVIDNTYFSGYYNALLSVPVRVELGVVTISKHLVDWVNDGLMAIFFLLVGLEIKREVFEGELNSLAKIILPGFAAIGGMLIPALIYLAINYDDSVSRIGWAIPTATDIAFALGVLTLLGKRVPVALKVFLTALAILDDLGAILIIAIFYTHDLSYISLILAAVCLITLFVFNLSGVRILTPYILVGMVLWVCVLKSGVHATLAGVALAFAIPLRDRKNSDNSPLRDLEHALHPWVAFGVLPIFAFFNAGLSFAGVTLKTFFNPIPLSIALGLFFGKQIGVFGFSWFAVKTKLARLPNGVNWHWLYGVSLLCGIGFTMSLFIGTLAFNEQGTEYAVLVRMGVLVGSFVSGLIGYMILLHKSRNSN